MAYWHDEVRWHGQTSQQILVYHGLMLELLSLDSCKRIRGDSIGGCLRWGATWDWSGGWWLVGGSLGAEGENDGDRNNGLPLFIMGHIQTGNNTRIVYPSKLPSLYQHHYKQAMP
ncbi:arginine--tRNA ligase [Striga asiatica]|uniref:Arginine--tRNA ligase n=1 Tax=Striga asiatica TaxID=4170 RepID=A0A5A7RK30_STRAF|nr:arginine--tRNA ligase [Striga asiatica]